MCSSDLAGARVLIKAASHILQSPTGINTLRQLLLDHAPSLVQDETALPYRLLSARFDTRLHGQYKGSNILFSNDKDLLAAFRATKDPAPLPMRFGYNKAAGSCVIVATRRATPVQPDLAPQPLTLPVQPKPPAPAAGGKQP